MGGEKHISQGIRKSETGRIQRRIQADLPKAEAALLECVDIASDFDRQLDDLLDATIDLIAVPEGTALADHVRAITIDPLLDGIQRPDAESLTRLMLHGSRPDVCAALAWHEFQEAKRSNDPEIVRQRMAGGAYFYGRACAANVDAKSEFAHSKGGKKKAANAASRPPNPERVAAENIKKQKPGLSAKQIKTRLSLKASPRTIRGWLASFK